MNQEENDELQGEIRDAHKILDDIFSERASGSPCAQHTCGHSVGYRLAELDESLWPTATLTSQANCTRGVGGLCYAHGQYDGNKCPKWPACATDPQIHAPAAPERDKESGAKPATVVMAATRSTRTICSAQAAKETTVIFEESGEQVKLGCIHESGIHIFNASGQCQWCKQSSDHLSALSTLKDRVEKLREHYAQSLKNSNETVSGLITRAKRAELSLSTLRSSFAERAERAAKKLWTAEWGMNEGDFCNRAKAIILEEFPAEFEKEQP